MKGTVTKGSSGVHHPLEESNLLLVMQTKLSLCTGADPQQQGAYLSREAEECDSPVVGAHPLVLFLKDENHHPGLADWVLTHGYPLQPSTCHTRQLQTGTESSPSLRLAPEPEPWVKMRPGRYSWYLSTSPMRKEPMFHDRIGSLARDPAPLAAA